MPSGQNSVYSPASRPVFDPDPVRGDRKRYHYAAAAAVAELPPYVVVGAVNVLAVSPGYPAQSAGTITSTVVTVLTNPASTTVQFKIRKNGVVQATHSVSATGITTFAESIAVAVNDLLTVEISGFGAGTMTGLLIEMRLS